MTSHLDRAKVQLQAQQVHDSAWVFMSDVISVGDGGRRLYNQV